jgi:multidrug efflux pump subunit AcrB
MRHASTGQFSLTVFFAIATDPDITQVQLQNRVNGAAVPAGLGAGQGERSQAR